MKCVWLCLFFETLSAFRELGSWGGVGNISQTEAVQEPHPVIAPVQPVLTACVFHRGMKWRFGTSPVRVCVCLLSSRRLTDRELSPDRLHGSSWGNCATWESSVGPEASLENRPKSFNRQDFWKYTQWHEDTMWVPLVKWLKFDFLR